MASGLPLDQLAADINARLAKGDSMFASAAIHLAEAKTRVDAGEANGRAWENWCGIYIKTPWEELRQRLSAAERRELITSAVAQKLTGGGLTTRRETSPKTHKSTGIGRGVGGGRPKAATTRAAEDLGVSTRTVQRAVKAAPEGDGGYGALVRAWLSASPEAQKRFLKEVQHEL